MKRYLKRIRTGIVLLTFMGAQTHAALCTQLDTSESTAVSESLSSESGRSLFRNFFLNLGGDKISLITKGKVRTEYVGVDISGSEENAPNKMKITLIPIPGFPNNFRMTVKIGKSSASFVTMGSINGHFEAAGNKEAIESIDRAQTSITDRSPYLEALSDITVSGNDSKMVITFIGKNKTLRDRVMLEKTGNRLTRVVIEEDQRLESESDHFERTVTDVQVLDQEVS